MSCTNGVNGTHASPDQSLKWELGIINGAGKYLTAEPFGYKLNVSATSLKKRQLWTIIPDSKEEHFYIMSHLKMYLSADKDGKVSCELDERGQEERFYIEYCPNGTGKWAFKSVSYGYYLTGSEDRIECFSKSPSWWSVKLAIHPQVHMQNQKRQRYVHLQNDELQGEKIVPWGFVSLVTIEQTKSGKVAVCSHDHRYLLKDGGLTNTINEDAEFGLELRGGTTPGVSFRDREGKYLTLIGNKGTLKTKNKNVGKDEMFSLEVSFPQVGLKAHNGKFASIKQGVDLYANQIDAEETETFQLEYVGHDGLWRLRCNNGKYWSVTDVNNGIKASGSGENKSSLFELQYLSESSAGITLKSSANSMFVTSRKLGLMSALGDDSSASESSFRAVLLNRPDIIFKSDFGLVGTRTGRVECSMNNYEAFILEIHDDGLYSFKQEKTGFYWSVSNDNQVKIEAITGGTEPMRAQKFAIHFITGQHCTLRSELTGKLVRGEQNGPMKADGEDNSDRTCLWEF